MNIFNKIKKMYHFEYIPFENKNNTSKNLSYKKRILIINSCHGTIGGAEIYSLNLYKNLISKGHHVSFLVVEDTHMQNKLKELKIPHYTFTKIVIFKSKFYPGLYKALHKICTKEKIQIIHCNIHNEIIAAKKISKKLNIKIVFTYHTSKLLRSIYIKKSDGIICVNNNQKDYCYNFLNSDEKKQKLLEIMTPLMDVDKFINFSTKYNDRKKFFKEQFNIKIKNLPILCTIAHLSIDKNHSLLLKAINKLIYEKNIPVQLVLAGIGGQEQLLKKLTQSLKIHDYVYFLGHTDKIADILFHSNIKVLSSKKETFGIVLMEASLLKKPLIGATKTGMVNVIKHNQTGLLFENNNVDSLVEQIETLLKNPNLCKKLGENAYNFVKENFNSTKLMEKLDNFYKKVINN
ncbi:glycosyltransferase family 4 protein [Candidatus Babeliales bacterium]|nr:glycosyltransferase family 4 protein [Candidatus Babeliales bacterium]